MLGATGSVDRWRTMVEPASGSGSVGVALAVVDRGPGYLTHACRPGAAHATSLTQVCRPSGQVDPTRHRRLRRPRRGTPTLSLSRAGACGVG